MFILAEGELVQEQTEAKKVERNISQLQHDMVKLNTLVAKKKSEQESLEQGNILMEGDFVHALKVSNTTVQVYIYTDKHTHTYTHTHTHVHTHACNVHIHLLLVHIGS